MQYIAESVLLSILCESPVASTKQTYKPQSQKCIGSKLNRVSAP